MTDPEPTEVSDLVAAAAASPTEMAGAVETDTESAFAWGLTEPILDDESHRPRSWLVTGAAVAASLAVVAAAAWVAVPHLRGTEQTPVPPVPVVTPTTTATTVAPVAAPPPVPPDPPAVTVTTVVVQPPPPVTPAPQTPAAPQWVSIYDQQLFNRLSAQGITIRDYASMARDAHLVCAHLANGQPLAGVKQEYAAASGGNAAIGEIFVSTVMATYPSCP